MFGKMLEAGMNSLSMNTIFLSTLKIWNILVSFFFWKLKTIFNMLYFMTDINNTELHFYCIIFPHSVYDAM